MKHYIVYHNPETMGYDADDIDGFSVSTSKSVGDIIGSRIWVITGRGKPRRYALAQSFIADSKKSDPGDPEVTIVSGAFGTRYPKDTFLNGRPWFPAFKRTMGNFGLGFQRLNSAASIEALESILAAPVAPALPVVARRPAGIREVSNTSAAKAASTYYNPTSEIDRAISIRQPYAELILRGEKRLEYRSQPTRIRERVWIYAAKTPADDEQAWQLVGADATDLPTGLILGSVEISNSKWDEENKCFAYTLEKPIRLSEPKQPVNQPLPLFWKPEFADG